MNRKLLKVIICLFLYFCLAGQAPGREIIIGTGVEGGFYHQVGRAICRLVNKRFPDAKCKAIATTGSLYNLSNLRIGALDFGLVQSDWLYHAMHGTGPIAFMGASFENLRAVFSLQNESFTLVVRRDSGIRQLADLPGHRVNIGNPGSSDRAVMQVIMQTMGWDKNDFLLAAELNAAEQSLALCHDRIQAIMYRVEHPNPTVARAIGLCEATLAPLSGQEIDKIVANKPYFEYTRIPGGIYKDVPDPVASFGVLLTMVTNTNVDPVIVHQVVAAVFENLAAFKQMHGAFGVLDPVRMTHQGLSAPLHNGAKNYYERQGIVVPGAQ